jgi:predicted Ser/Thr protein kinase
MTYINEKPIAKLASFEDFLNIAEEATAVYYVEHGRVLKALADNVLWVGDLSRQPEKLKAKWFFIKSLKGVRVERFMSQSDAWKVLRGEEKASPAKRVGLAAKQS